MDLTTIIEQSSAIGTKKVALQLPEGIRTQAHSIATQIRAREIDVVLLADPCYGACDLPAELPRGCEALIHAGHLPMPTVSTDYHVYYLDYPIDLDIEAVLDSIAKIEEIKLGMTTTAQHVHQLSALIERSKKELVIGIHGERSASDGHVLGCDLSAARAIADEVEAFVHLGEGDFHAIGVRLATGKKTYRVTPTGDIFDIEKRAQKYLKRRHATIARASEAHRWGVVTSSKIGQNRQGEAELIVQKIRNYGMEADLIMASEITPEILMNFSYDAYVVVACPRISIDDSIRYEVPVISKSELSFLLGEKHELEFDLW